jgi:putative ABC transport system substrate-binding protein
MANGQVLLVTTAGLSGGPPIRTVYYVAEENPTKALAIIAKIMAPNETGAADATRAHRCGDWMMRRREFISLLVGAVSVRPLTARAQPAMPVIGYLSAGSPGRLMTLLRQTLAEAGYVEGRNLAIESRLAEGQYDRLPTMAAELVRRQVTVIVASPTPAALAAKAATTTIPIVFGVTDDPVKLGLVASLARPGGNATGINFYIAELGLSAKRLGLLRELVPWATRIAALVNPKNAPNAEAVTRDVAAAAAAIGVRIDVIHASDSREIEAAFATLVRNRAEALLVGTDPFFYSRRLQLATLATRHAIPAVYTVREYPEAGGLMSYGTSLTEVYRHLGAYTGRILAGAKPADLPVAQSTSFELVINLPTARALGLDIPPTLLARADDAIEWAGRRSSARGQKLARFDSIDYLVCCGEDARRNREPKRLGGLEIDDKLERVYLLDRQVGGAGALKNATGVITAFVIARNSLRANLMDELFRSFAHRNQ